MSLLTKYMQNRYRIVKMRSQKNKREAEEENVERSRKEEDEDDDVLNSSGNPDHFDRLPTLDSFDEDDGDFPPSPGGANTEGGRRGAELDTPEGDIGICRSQSAKSSKIEDLTLSDIILDPDGNVTYYWLGAVTLAVVYNIAVIVLRLAFQEMRDPVIQESVFYLCDSMGDLVYVLDLLVHLRISFYEDGCLVLDPRRIVERYAHSRKFVMDILAILPLSTMYSVIAGVGSLLYLDPSAYIAGDVHIMIVRIPRLLKYPTMARFFDLTDSRTRNPNSIRAFKLSLNLWLVIHWVGCLYYMVSEYEGLGTSAWVYPSDAEYSAFTRKYIRVMYWSLMTLTTIGERPSPETDLEFVFTGLTFLVGVFVFAAVVGNVGDVITNMNAARQDFQSRMDQIKSYLLHRNVDESLQNRVKRWANYTWQRTQAIDEPTLLQMLPDRLRTEIAINVHLETLKKVKIFEECEEGLLRELVLKLRPQVYSPGDYICRIGEVGREMYIVNHGKVEILVPSSVTGRRTVIATLAPGNYFGEISLLKIDDGQNRRTADVRAVGYSELLRLSRKDLLTALVEYPNAKRILEQQAKERIHKTNLMRRTSAADDITPTIVQSVDQQPTKKKDLLLQVIKSQNFQKLISSKNSEAKELQTVIDTLKQFDSQATKDKMEALSKERDDLRRSLDKATEELQLLRRKLAIVVSKKRPTSSMEHSNIKNGILNKLTLTRTSGEARLNGCLPGDTVGKDSRVSKTGMSSVKTKFANKEITGAKRKNSTFSNNSTTAGQTACQCRTLQHSRSVPNIFKNTTSGFGGSKSENSKSFTNFMNKKLNSTSVSKMSKSPCKNDGDKTAQVPSIHINDLDTSDDLERSGSLTDDARNEKDLQVLENLLNIDTDSYLSDASVLSSEDSSDCDLDLEVGN